MFVPVSCTNCGKPFQVPDAALGKPAACPWCQSVVTALPVAATSDTPPTPEPPKPAVPVAKAGEAAPLSLDDDPPAKVPFAMPVTPPAPRAKFSPATLFVGLVLVVAVMSLTVVILGYGSGRVSEGAWAQYTAPDDSCSLLMPGAPTEEEVAPNLSGSVTGGKRYTARGWYTRTSAWLAWNDLEPGFAASVAKDKDRVFTASAIQSELNREKARLEGTVKKEMEIRFGTAWGIEVHMDTPRGKVVERFVVVADNPRPRLYVYGMQAKNITPESAVVSRLFTSFKVND